MQAQLKTNVRTRTMTRNRLVVDTLEKFLHIPRAHGRDMSFWDSNLEMMVRNEFLSELEIVAHDGDAIPLGGITLTCDWQENKSQIISFGDEVDMSGIEEGGTFASISEALKVLKAYFDGICDQVGAAHISIWFTLNPVEVEKYGTEKIYQTINYECLPEREVANAQVYAQILSAQRAGKRRTTVLADVREIRTGAWRGA